MARQICVADLINDGMTVAADRPNDLNELYDFDPAFAVLIFCHERLRPFEPLCQVGLCGLLPAVPA